MKWFKQFVTKLLFIWLGISVSYQDINGWHLLDLASSQIIPRKKKNFNFYL